MTHYIRYRNAKTGRFLYLTSPAQCFAYNALSFDRGFAMPLEIAQRQAKLLPRLPGSRFKNYGRASVTKTPPQPR